MVAKESQSYESLLAAYLSNDRSLQEVALQYEQAVLSYQKMQVQNAFNMKLSSGSARLDMSNEETTLSLSPSVSMDFPEIQNSKIEAKLPLTILLNDESSYSINDAGLSLSTDLLSSAKKNRALTLKKAEESLSEANRKKDAKILSLTKEFLQALKSMYSQQSNVLTQEESALSKERDLALLKAQGFEENSAKYRLAYLSWQTQLRSYEEVKRSYEKEVLDFAKKCGVEAFDSDIIIPQEPLRSLETFPKTEFSSIRTSLLNYENNRLSQDAKTPFQLGFNAGYGFSLTEKNQTQEIKNTVSTGLSFKKNGLTASLGMQNTLEALENPRFTFSLDYSFSEQKISQISNAEELVQEKILLLAIDNAEAVYESTLSEKEKQKDTLLWQLDKNKEHESLYADLADDMKAWYDKGIISETEYKQALANYLKAGTERRITELDCLIYNVDIATLFN